MLLSHISSLFTDALVQKLQTFNEFYKFLCWSKVCNGVHRTRRFEFRILFKHIFLCALTHLCSSTVSFYIYTHYVPEIFVATRTMTTGGRMTDRDQPNKLPRMIGTARLELHVQQCFREFLTPLSSTHERPINARCMPQPFNIYYLRDGDWVDGRGLFRF